jgi:transposase-like protein
MLQRIRYGLGYANKTDKGNGQFTGVVEADETFVGGKNKNRHKNKKFNYGKDRYFDDKTPILGLYSNGRVKTVVIKDTSLASIKPYMRWNIRIGAVVVTDEWRAYKHLSRFYHHETVRHDLGQYLSYGTSFTTNNIEGFWCWIKRMIMGIYHVVSKKHLQFYANEATFRFNTRTLTERSRLVEALALINHPIKYKQLISR